MPDPLRVLGFDTSAAHCAAAVVCGDRVLAERAEAMTKGQAERLFPLIGEVMAQAGLAWSDLDAIGVGIGPGNFTGVRISVAAARGLALSLGIPAIGISATEAAACGAPRPCRAVVPLRGDEVVWEDFGLPQDGAWPQKAMIALGQAGPSGPAEGGPAPGKTCAAAERAAGPEPAATMPEGNALSPDSSLGGTADHDVLGTAWPRPGLGKDGQAGESQPPGRTAEDGPALSPGAIHEAVANPPGPERQGADTRADRGKALPFAEAALSHVPAGKKEDGAGCSFAPGPRLGHIDGLPSGPPVCTPLWPVAVAVALAAHERMTSGAASIADGSLQAFPGFAASGPRPAPLYLRPADAAPPRDPPPVILR